MADSETIRQTLLVLATERAPERSFCPSEAARRLSRDWRPLMPQVRGVAATLVTRGELRCSQRGRPADPLHTPGAIRLAAPPPP